MDDTHAITSTVRYRIEPIDCVEGISLGAALSGPMVYALGTGLWTLPGWDSLRYVLAVWWQYGGQLAVNVFVPAAMLVTLAMWLVRRR